MIGKALVVGYGNSLRSDDGIGWHVAQRLTEDPRFAAADVVQRHQLTPELALDLSTAALAVFVDASIDVPAGHFTVTPVERVRGVSNNWSHHLSPATLVSLSCELYGRSADAYVVRCGVQSIEIGARLTPVAEAVLPDVVDAVAELVRQRSEVHVVVSDPCVALH